MSESVCQKTQRKPVKSAVLPLLLTLLVVNFIGVCTATFVLWDFKRSYDTHTKKIDEINIELRDLTRVVESQNGQIDTIIRDKTMSAEMLHHLNERIDDLGRLAKSSDATSQPK